MSDRRNGVLVLVAIVVACLLYIDEPTAFWVVGTFYFTEKRESGETKILKIL